MTDVLTKKQRSYCMSQIRARDTQPEIILRKAISSAGISGYRLNYRLLGKPDIVFPKRKIAVFIDGCFWHKCPRCFIKPDTNKKFWNEKIASNVKRDKIVNTELKRKGWKVLRIWEHELRKGKIIKRKILDNIKDGRKKD
ncbi:MAG: very short patch repair endonuclease [Candidatus Omnitrophota bacterium]